MERFRLRYSALVTPRARRNSGGVTRHQKLLERILSADADQSIRFDRLCAFLLHLGFDERQSGSHRIFTREGAPGIINLQPRRDGTAKPYQVRQVRDFILSHGVVLGLRKETDDEC
jgi:hypothetical protein